MTDLKGKKVVVTGAAGGLGVVVCADFLRRGAVIAALDLSLEALESRWPDVEGVTRYAVDLLDPDAVIAVAEGVASDFGEIDGLVNLAGGFSMGDSVHETPDAVFERLFNLNVKTLINSLRAFTPALIASHGAIVNVGARGGVKGTPGMGAYAASKSAVHRLTEAQSAELRERRVNVNAVLPGIIDTPANRAAMPTSDPSLWVSPAALADTIAFLLSDSARDIHGILLPVEALS